MSVMSDQQAGGLIMWIGTGTLYLGALTYIFFRWVRESEASERFVGSTPTEATKTS
jgi:cytochrome c oxidase assembly factor CtaG